MNFVFVFLGKMIPIHMKSINAAGLLREKKIKKINRSMLRHILLGIPGSTTQSLEKKKKEKSDCFERERLWACHMRS